MHRGMDMKGTMAGMASPADMARLATLRGTDFDRLFLSLMIAHHDGALKMVDALVKKPGSAYDPVLFQFTSDVKTEQKAEIDRMSALLGTLATDPRVALTAGFKDAGQAASHLALVASASQAHRLLRSDQRGGCAAPQGQEEERGSQARRTRRPEQ